MSDEVTRLHLSSAGGFAGLQQFGVLSAEEIPKELKARVLKALKSRQLPAKAATPDGAADSFQYQLRVGTADGKAQNFQFDELAAAPEVLDLVDSIREEMRQRGKWGRGRGERAVEEEKPEGGLEE
jgi:hypothetical protein